MVVVYSRKKRLLKKNLRNSGRGMLLGSVLVLATIVLLPLSIGKQQSAQRLKEMVNNQITFSDLLKVEAGDQAKVTMATYFTVEIPKIKALAKVKANVDASNKMEYAAALKEGVAHAKGTLVPGMGGSVTLFAHSTDSLANVERFNAVFYRLDELSEGDEVIVWFLGEKYVYRVRNIKIVEPDNVEVFIKKTDGEKLYLVTCTPRGTTEKRLIVEAGLEL